MYMMRLNKKKGVKIGRYKIHVYDSGPHKGADRYTICIDGGDNGDRHVLTANAVPFHPQYGIGQYVGVLYYVDLYGWAGGVLFKSHRRYGIRPGPHLGRLIAWDDVPDDVKSFTEGFLVVEPSEQPD